MADHIVPHFANDLGAEKVTIGVKEFKCMGARAPYDHPHVFLEHGIGFASAVPLLLDICTCMIRGSEPMSRTPPTVS